MPSGDREGHPGRVARITWIPRIELHLIYNTAVSVPMGIGMYYHMFPPKGQTVRARCACAWHGAKTPSAALA